MMHKDEFDNLEREIEREIALLDDLSPIEPPTELVARLKQQVADEARRLRRRHGWLRFTRSSTGVAAAIVLVTGLYSLYPGTPAAPNSEYTDDELVARIDAWDASADCVVSFLDDGWVASDFGMGGDDESDVDDLWSSLGDSLGQFDGYTKES